MLVLEHNRNNDTKRKPTDSQIRNIFLSKCIQVNIVTILLLCVDNYCHNPVIIVLITLCTHRACNEVEAKYDSGLPTSVLIDSEEPKPKPSLSQVKDVSMTLCGIIRLSVM